MDPATLVAGEMSNLTTNIHALLGSVDIDLDGIAKYYVRNDGAKRIRPLLVLLMSKTVSRIHPRDASLEDEPLSSAAVLNDRNPSLSLHTATDNPDISPSQKRLAEITEMIHAASLLHDDVIDESELRRGQPSANFAFSSKMSVLAGDFMLGRASVALARLRNPEVIELLATVIANLVEGEFMQLKNTIDEGHESTMEYYLQKTYLKTASLISKSCRAAAILGGASSDAVEAAYEYGKNVGLAFQVVDDMLDYTVSAESLGKPAGADLKLGLATAPVLYAWREHPQLGALIKRKFCEPGDCDMARLLTQQSKGLEHSQALAASYRDRAIEALQRLPPSSSRDSLESIANQVLSRKR
ncbi:isoprenoid synthase domain-containing protein [Protomyces lactucae-debilis]|uniref:Isoprenoid synthase domain-containing protein n=1 Tax=Protomyces lactucae-debilis TaxID=2754530 RepID=A0A1Y2F6P7_PROLT|nr:isoprenoid synthase domain-containing protein [Protomyces lactucae-debilis]ORY79551.1 isoprenoid synthase domain-containing protein [Protomyces lactucae-debilis]